jgi:hypothetical protein
MVSVRGQRFDRGPKDHGMADLAFATGGLMSSLDNLKILNNHPKQMPANYFATAANKLLEELTYIADQLLVSIVEYKTTVDVGETVF